MTRTKKGCYDSILKCAAFLLPEQHFEGTLNFGRWGVYAAGVSKPETDLIFAPVACANTLVQYENSGHPGLFKKRTGKMDEKRLSISCKLIYR